MSNYLQQPLNEERKESRFPYTASPIPALIMSIFCDIMAAIFFYRGFDKMTNYNNSTWRSVNAYVGGDAYNYIINGTYSTSFFVLGVGFMLAGVIAFAISVFIKKKNTSESIALKVYYQNEKIIQALSLSAQAVQSNTNNSNTFEDLPNL